ncbi:hypothetical protein AK812_SmicGene1825 [Symbiodinium microadriaticum]|uniref:Uncharacterized protein n=1 Tax=Symbiodinium microadriaticum TaxID=2951 RepID=A0A1Q9F2X3_SYMMI|nr:hypothetical protein AK812_SmicGene1825 [Symbiodinium microadriaticum]
MKPSDLIYEPVLSWRLLCTSLVRGFAFCRRQARIASEADFLLWLSEGREARAGRLLTLEEDVALLDFLGGGSHEAGWQLRARTQVHRELLQLSSARGHVTQRLGRLEEGSVVVLRRSKHSSLPGRHESASPESWPGRRSLHSLLRQTAWMGKKAAAGELPEDFSGCSFTHAKAFDPDDEALPALLAAADSLDGEEGAGKKTGVLAVSWLLRRLPLQLSRDFLLLYELLTGSRSVGLREAAALVDAAAVYLAFRANNPLGDVVLAYARTSFAELDAMLSHLEVDRARLIRGAVFADYLYGAGTRFSLDQARFLPVLEAAVSLREAVIASAARTAIDKAVKAQVQVWLLPSDDPALTGQLLACLVPPTELSANPALAGLLRALAAKPELAERLPKYRGGMVESFAQQLSDSLSQQVEALKLPPSPAATRFAGRFWSLERKEGVWHSIEAVDEKAADESPSTPMEEDTGSPLSNAGLVDLLQTMSKFGDRRLPSTTWDFDCRRRGLLTTPTVASPTATPTPPRGAESLLQGCRDLEQRLPNLAFGQLPALTSKPLGSLDLGRLITTSSEKLQADKGQVKHILGAKERTRNQPTLPPVRDGVESAAARTRDDNTTLGIPDVDRARAPGIDQGGPFVPMQQMGFLTPRTTATAVSPPAWLGGLEMPRWMSRLGTYLSLGGQGDPLLPSPLAGSTGSPPGGPTFRLRSPPRRDRPLPRPPTPSSSSLPAEAIQMEVQRQMGQVLNRLHEAELENERLRTALEDTRRQASTATLPPMLPGGHVAPVYLSLLLNIELQDYLQVLVYLIQSHRLRRLR